MTWKRVLRLFNPSLFDAIQPYAITSDAQMPLAYQKAAGGRWLSNDWGLLWLPSYLQPWQKIPRMDRAYRPPMPFKQTSGKGSKQWMLCDPSYPLSPGAQTMMRDFFTVNGTFSLLHVLVDVADDDGWAVFAGFIGGVWRPRTFIQYHKLINIPLVGPRTVKFYWGFRPDITVSAPLAAGGPIRSDVAGWFPEGGVTLVK